ncbi:MAG: NAD(P)-dependent oxidoreductase, partial [Leptospiraceae bacterium]|nr:NAD(P)-dependent oxidoreductase [Leptospiraceae bacterium]
LFNFSDVSAMIHKIQPTHLLHFAWYAVPGKFWSAVENLEWVSASLNLLKEFSKIGQRAVFAGSSAEYDWNYGYCTENYTPLEPLSLYGTCKNSLQKVFTSYTNGIQLQSVWGRIFFLYGPNEPKEKLVGGLIHSLINGKIFETSSGEQIRDFLYVEDVADAFVALLESNVTGNVNIASGLPVKVKDFILKIAEQMDKVELVKIGARPTSLAEPPFLLADVTRLNKEVGWVPKRTLNEGIQATINWWKENQS